MRPLGRERRRGTGYGRTVSEQQGRAPGAPGGPTGDGGPTDEPRLPEDAVPVRVRRAARYRPFVVTGALLGALAGVVVALARATGDAAFSMAQLTGYLGAIGLLVGAVLGALVAVLADRPRSARRP